MNEIFKQYIQKIAPVCQDENGENYAYAIFRIVVSFMFLLHGTQKIFGFLGGVDGAGQVAPMFSLFWFAGLIEVVVGALVLAGIFTRLAALAAIVDMIVAYLVVHIANGIIPLLNGGELAVLYLVSFLLIFRYGAGKLSLEKKYCRSEKF